MTMMGYNHIPDAMTLIGVNIMFGYVTSFPQYFDILSFISSALNYLDIKLYFLLQSPENDQKKINWN